MIDADTMPSTTDPPSCGRDDEEEEADSCSGSKSAVILRNSSSIKESKASQDSVGPSCPSQSQSTKESTIISPHRSRKLEPPPMPRRADFGDHYPDGGWGWVVCGAAFSVNFLCHGLLLAFGSLYMEVVTRFGAQEDQVGESIA